jgi:hypothetical protein
MPALRRLMPLVLILAIGAAHALALRPGHEWGDDFALYLLHARNLVEGRPYADTGYLYNPHYASIGPPTYPPVTPALLAPVYALAGPNLEALKLAMVAGFTAFLAVAYLLFRRTLSPARSALVVALLGLNGFSFQAANTIGSDEFFLVFLYAALLLFERADDAAEDSRTQWLLAIGAAVAAWLAFGTRSLGVLVLVALAIRELIARRRIGRPALGAMALFAALALTQTLLVHSDRHYLDQLGGGPGLLLQHAAWYAERLAAFWSNGRWRLPALLLTGAALLLAVIGFVRQVRTRRAGICEVFALLYLAVILLWPSYEAERYLYPVIPLWLFYAFCGLEHAGLARRPVLARTALGLLLVGAVLSYAGRYATLDWGPFTHGVATPEARALFRCVTDHTRPDDVVLFAKPRAMALFTRRTSAAPYVAQRDEELWAYARSIHASYLVTNRDGVLGRAENAELTQFLRAFVARHPGQFTPLCANADFTLYRIRP